MLTRSRFVANVLLCHAGFVHCVVSTPNVLKVFSRRFIGSLVDEPAFRFAAPVLKCAPWSMAIESLSTVGSSGATEIRSLDTVSSKLSRRIFTVWLLTSTKSYGPSAGVCAAVLSRSDHPPCPLSLDVHRTPNGWGGQQSDVLIEVFLVPPLRCQNLGCGGLHHTLHTWK